MERLKSGWRSTPGHIRKPIVLVAGMFFIVAAGLTGWLPGPGGIPLFLIGIAILATEFVWAQRVRDITLRIVKIIGTWMRHHKVLATLAIIVCIGIAIGASLFVKSLLHW
ncbi:MAG TPA: PGPGW domain-containing protein [Candidatus Saccharimonadales bacterium]|jgi:hypothetical protein|nr:PGPGW domain-containing protein [Candidatus Saccharimonadales bacterium]